jgi:hypothetical protein
MVSESEDASAVTANSATDSTKMFAILTSIVTAEPAEIKTEPTLMAATISATPMMIATQNRHVKKAKLLAEHRKSAENPTSGVKVNFNLSNFGSWPEVNLGLGCSFRFNRNLTIFSEEYDSTFNANLKLQRRSCAALCRILLLPAIAV